MTTTRDIVSIDDMKLMLADRIDSVLARYAPAAKGSHTTFGKYFTLNPGRADRHVGSFYVNVTGAKIGQWCDHAVSNTPGEGYGDIIDLIALSLGCSNKEAISEARAFLGLRTETPADRRRREEALKAARKRQERAKADEKAHKQKKARQAQAIFLSGIERLRDTPVHLYLRDQRGIDFERLGRQPGAIRYVQECYYYHECDETGEVFEGKWPAMVALIQDVQGKPIAVHRTYLALNDQGIWDKAPVPKAKKVLGLYGGGAIHVWKGIGPRGGKPGPLKDCPPDTHVMIAEGIEDCLSAVMLAPEMRVLAAISLSNFGGVKLPANVSCVTIVADNDDGPEQQEALKRAITAHQKEGREVRLFKNIWGGKDLNDALKGAQKAGTI
ncbi:DUF7146 domain-containing protein [Shimia sp.]|uniref:DUF7146 domain-containing protein n=1 Tax=Shimia sp. TaxID=1954381 RepID=UPI003BABA6BF